MGRGEKTGWWKWIHGRIATGPVMDRCGRPTGRYRNNDIAIQSRHTKTAAACSRPLPNNEIPKFPPVPSTPPCTFVANSSEPRTSPRRARSGGRDDDTLGDGTDIALAKRKRELKPYKLLFDNLVPSREPV